MARSSWSTSSENLRMLATPVNAPHQVELKHDKMILFELAKATERELGQERTPRRSPGRSIEEIAASPSAAITDEELRTLMEAWDLPAEPSPHYPEREAPRRPKLERKFQDPKLWAEYEKLGYGPMMTREKFKALVSRYRRMRARGRPLMEGYEYNPGRPYEGVGCEDRER